TVDSAGPSDALGVVVSDVIPVGTTFVSATAGGTYDPIRSEERRVGKKGRESDVADVLTVVVKVDANRTTGLSNTATVASDTTDPTPGNNSATEPTAVITSANLSITTSDSADTFTAFNRLTYPSTVDSAGPSDALGVVVSDVIPVGTTFVSATAGGTYDPI